MAGQSAASSNEDQVFIWLVKQEEHLHHIQERCIHLVREHKESCYRAPPFVLSSIAGALALCIPALPAEAHQGVALASGLASVAAAVMFASLVKPGRIIGELFQSLHDDIERELATPLTARNKSGAVFLRDAYNRFYYLPGAKYTDPLLKAYVEGVEADVHRIMSMAAAPPLPETPSPTTSSDEVLPQRARPSARRHHHHTGKSRLRSSSTDFSIDMLPDSDDDESAKA